LELSPNTDFEKGYLLSYRPSFIPTFLAERGWLVRSGGIHCRIRKVDRCRWKCLSWMSF